MPNRKLISPEHWASVQLEQEREKAIQVFVDRRLSEGDPDYLRQFAESERMVAEFLDLSGNLLVAKPEIFLNRVDLLEDIGRFVAGPPISADDFRTLLGIKKLHSGEKSEVSEALALIGSLIDSSRFRWVSEKRKPTKIELQSSIVATASLRAVERARTERRSSEKERQESYVAQFIREIRLNEVERVSHPDNDMLPGSFKRGVKFEGKQCDVLVRLYDERFLTIECKSSNSAVNSIKRLNDVSDKAQVWKTARGAKVITAGVLAGVFDLQSLETAQEKSVFLFWEHNLKPLKSFLVATRKA